jgi:hypothetical protein
MKTTLFLLVIFVIMKGCSNIPTNVDTYKVNNVENNQALIDSLKTDNAQKQNQQLMAKEISNWLKAQGIDPNSPEGYQMRVAKGDTYFVFNDLPANPDPQLLKEYVNLATKLAFNNQFTNIRNIEKGLAYGSFEVLTPQGKPNSWIFNGDTTWRAQATFNKCDSSGRIIDSAGVFIYYRYSCFNPFRHRNDTVGGIFDHVIFVPMTNIGQILPGIAANTPMPSIDSAFDKANYSLPTKAEEIKDGVAQNPFYPSVKAQIFGSAIWIFDGDKIVHKWQKKKPFPKGGSVIPFKGPGSATMGNITITFSKNGKSIVICRNNINPTYELDISRYCNSI